MIRWNLIIGTLFLTVNFTLRPVDSNRLEQGHAMI